MGGPRIPQLLVPKNGRTQGWGRSTGISLEPAGRTARHVPVSYDIARTNRNGRPESLQQFVFAHIFPDEIENVKDEKISY